MSARLSGKCLVGRWMIAGVAAVIGVSGCAGSTPTLTRATASGSATPTARGAPATSVSTRPAWPPTDGEDDHPATADAPPPYIASATWVSAPHGRSLHIVPTAAGRTVHGGNAHEVAWQEVLRMAPDAGSPGMRAQFDCHWVYARIAAPDKPSWNIEPWRPVVTDRVMAQEGCNPGGPD